MRTRRGKVNTLVSASGRRVALLRIFREALHGLRLDGIVLAADIVAASPAFQDADEAFLVPRCTRPEFIPELLRACDVHDIRVVVPTIDPELTAYANCRSEFERIGTYVAVSDPAVIEIARDKQRTHRWLVENGFPTVRTASLAEVLRDVGAWTFPLIAKPREGSASIGVEVVHDLAALTRLAAERDYVLQTVASGFEYTVDVYVDSAGACRCAVPRRRLEVRSGEVSKSITVRLPEVEALARSIAEALPGARGALNIQVFHNPADGETSVIEINPRFGGGYPLSEEAGAHYAAWTLQEARGMEIDASPDCWRAGVVMLRWDDAVFVSAESAGLR